MDKFIVTLVFLILSIVVFVSSSELAYTLDHRRNFDYANPTYILAVITALSSVGVGAVMLLELYRWAMRRLKTLYEEAEH